MTNLDSILKSRDIANKGPSSQSYCFSSSHVWMWELDYKESWVPKNWCFWTMVLEKTLQSPLNCQEIQSIHPKGNQSWMFIGRTDVEAGNSNTLATSCEELTHLKKPWSWERLRAGREGDDRGWDGWMVSPTQWTWVWVGCTSWWWTRRPGVLHPWGRKASDMTERLNWAKCQFFVFMHWWEIALGWLLIRRSCHHDYKCRDQNISQILGKGKHLSELCRLEELKSTLKVPFGFHPSWCQFLKNAPFHSNTNYSLIVM